MKLSRHASQSDAIIAIGANIAGAWGPPEQTLAATLQRVGAAGMDVKDASGLYLTTGLGGGSQPRYLNAVFIVRSHLAPAALLRFFKTLERDAGRRLGHRWGPRCLDLDIIAQAGPRRMQYAGCRARGQLILPHPHLSERGFVLLPLREIAPHWHHPVLHRTAIQLLAQPRIQRQLRGIMRLPGTSQLLMHAAHAQKGNNT